MGKGPSDAEMENLHFISALTLNYFLFIHTQSPFLRAAEKESFQVHHIEYAVSKRGLFQTKSFPKLVLGDSI